MRNHYWVPWELGNTPWVAICTSVTTARCIASATCGLLVRSQVLNWSARVVCSCGHACSLAVINVGLCSLAEWCIVNRQMTTKNQSSNDYKESKVVGHRVERGYYYYCKDHWTIRHFQVRSFGCAGSMNRHLRHSRQSESYEELVGTTKMEKLHSHPSYSSSMHCRVPPSHVGEETPTQLTRQ